MSRRRTACILALRMLLPGAAGRPVPTGTIQYHTATTGSASISPKTSDLAEVAVAPTPEPVQVLLTVSPAVPLLFGEGPAPQAGHFQPAKWSSHHGSADSLAIETLWTMGTHAGRSLKADEQVFPTVPEDPSRPGYAKLSFLHEHGVVTSIAQKINLSLALYGREKYQLIMALSARQWPPYMVDPNGSSPLPQNVQAAAELVSEFVAAVSEQAGGYLPRYFEAVNEPDTTKFSGNETLVQLYQVAVRKELERRFGSKTMLVGGPAFAGSNLAHNKYRDIPQLVYSPDQSFISMHLFDTFWSSNTSDGTQSYAISRNAGGHIAAVFDLVEASTLAEYGRIFPMLPSEHGLATDGSATKNSLVPDKLLGEPLRALQVDSHWGQLMSLFDRSEHILHTSAFLLSSSDSAMRNPSVCMGVPKDKNAVTATAFSYQLLKTLVNTSRVASIVTSAPSTINRAGASVRSQHVLAHAFRSLGGDDKYVQSNEQFVKIALKNLEDFPVSVKISLDEGCSVIQARYAARAFITADGTQKSNLGSSLHWQSSGPTVLLEPRESSVIQVTCSPQTTELAPLLTRRLRYYSSTTGVSLPQNREINFKVPLASVPFHCSRIVVRLGLSTDFGTNASLPIHPPPANPPKVSLNGHSPSSDPTQLWSNEKLFPKGWTNVWRTFEYEFSSSSLTAQAVDQAVKVLVDDPQVPVAATSISAVAMDVYTDEVPGSASAVIALKTDDETDRIGNAHPGEELWRNTSLPIQQRVDDLVSRMSTDELIAQLSNTAGAFRNESAYEFGQECLSGFQTKKLWASLLPQPSNISTSAFPQPVNLGMTFDKDLARSIAAAIGYEARAAHTHLKHPSLHCQSPVLNIARDPRWGRCMETYGGKPLPH